MAGGALFGGVSLQAVGVAGCGRGWLWIKPHGPRRGYTDNRGTTRPHTPVLVDERRMQLYSTRLAHSEQLRELVSWNFLPVN